MPICIDVRCSMNLKLHPNMQCVRFISECGMAFMHFANKLFMHHLCWQSPLCTAHTIRMDMQHFLLFELTMDVPRNRFTGKKSRCESIRQFDESSNVQICELEKKCFRRHTQTRLSRTAAYTLWPLRICETCKRFVPIIVCGVRMNVKICRKWAVVERVPSFVRSLWYLCGWLLSKFGV